MYLESRTTPEFRWRSCVFRIRLSAAVSAVSVCFCVLPAPERSAVPWRLATSVVVPSLALPRSRVVVSLS